MLWLAILIIIVLTILFIVSFVVYKKIPVPKGCENIKISDENCAICDKDCSLKKERK